MKIITEKYRKWILPLLIFLSAVMSGTVARAGDSGSVPVIYDSSRMNSSVISVTVTGKGQAKIADETVREETKEFQVAKDKKTLLILEPDAGMRVEKITVNGKEKKVKNSIEIYGKDGDQEIVVAFGKEKKDPQKPQNGSGGRGSAGSSGSSVKTGDNTMVGIWIGICAFMLIALAVLWRRRKK